jgi:hypothetical protein
MDVYGKNPTDDAGEYFRNNVWWWRPLWEYCVMVSPDIAGEVEHGHSNDGDGLDADGARELAAALRRELESGDTALFELAYRTELAALPRKRCVHCEGTGVRSDAVGVELGMPEQELDEHTAIVLGRTHGTCNACHGEGKVSDTRTWYEFSEENVREFAEFLEHSGGFSIY